MLLRRIAVALAVLPVLFCSRLLLSQQSSTQAPPANQQQGVTDQDIALLRSDIRSQKKQMVAANMNLTDKEAEQFWPVYDQYTTEMVTINNKKFAAIKEYAQSYDTLTDDQAQNLIRQSVEVDESIAQLRLKYIPMFRKVLSGKKTAQFMQLDRRLVMLIDLQLASAIPMVGP
jgi:hypothetical protein